MTRKTFDVWQGSHGYGHRVWVQRRDLLDDKTSKLKEILGALCKWGGSDKTSTIWPKDEPDGVEIISFEIRDEDDGFYLRSVTKILEIHGFTQDSASFR